MSIDGGFGPLDRPSNGGRTKRVRNERTHVPIKDFLPGRSQQEIDKEAMHKASNVVDLPRGDERRDRDERPRPEGQADGADRAADEEVKVFIIGTVKAFGKRLLEHIADVHGVGLPLRAAEWVYKAVQWQRVAERHGTVEVAASIPLGPDIELELSAPLASDQDSHRLPLTVCCAPSGGAAVGVVEIGRLEIGPSADRARANLDSRHSAPVGEPESEPLPQHAALVPEDTADTAAETGQPLPSAIQLSESARPFEVVPMNLSTVGRVGSREEGLDALKHAAEQQLPQLRSKLRTRGTRFVVLYDLPTGRVLWLRLDEDDLSSPPVWHIEIKIDLLTGRLRWVSVRE